MPHHPRCRCQPRAHRRGLGVAARPPGVQVTTDYGIEFSTVGDPSNAPYATPPAPADVNPINWAMRPIGGVNYSYRMARTEVTTAQWMEFLNSYSTQNLSNPLFDFFRAGPFPWGATEDPAYHGPGVRYVLRTDVPNAGMLPVNGIGWRDAAIYCNWLHNGRSSDPAALQNGAYDISTFTPLFGQGGFDVTDQITHNAGAQFWIPTLDEWIKAAHYDPNKEGLGIGGYWQSGDGTDQPPTYGPPALGQVNAGFHFGDSSEWNIPLASYDTIQSPYGLFDVMGSTWEWSEAAFPPGTGAQHIWRALLGTSAGDFDVSLLPLFDQPGYLNWYTPLTSTGGGLRIASAIPAAGETGPVAIFITLLLTRRRR